MIKNDNDLISVWLTFLDVTFILYLQTRREWQNVFVIASMVHYCGVVFYAIFASGEKQDWADPESTSDEKCGIIEEDELAQETEASCDSAINSSKIKSYGTTTENSSGRKKGWKKKRGVTMQEEEAVCYENGDYQEQYQWHLVHSEPWTLIILKICF